MGLDLAQVEKALLPILSPLALQLWESTLLPAIQGELKSGSPEIQIIETALVEMLDKVVKAELAKLSGGVV